MSAEERMNTLLSETEDVAREDQIFLRDGVEMAMAEGIKLPKEEYAKLSSTIMERQHTYGRPSFDYAATFDNFYVYDYLGDGDSIINFAIPIIGYEEFTQDLSNAIENGTINSAASLDLFLKKVLSGEGSYHRNIVNAVKKQRGHKGFLVSGPRGQNNYSRGVSQVSKRSGGSIATRGTSGNIDEFADQELNSRHSLITPEMNAIVGDLENNGISIDNPTILKEYGWSALTLGKKGNYVTLSKIVSAEQGRGNGTRFMNDLIKVADGKMLYADKKKALDYFSVSAPVAEAQNNQELISVTNIIQNFANPTISEKFSLITPEMDADYLSAVERGDMATAQQIVMEAAKLAMPNTKVVDENGNALVGYYGDRMKARYKLSADIFFTLHSNYARLYIIA